MIRLERRVGGERLNDVESGLWTERHRNRYCAVQFDDRTWHELRQRCVERRDARPIRLLSGVSARMASGDGGLQRVRTSRAVQSFGAPQFSEPVADQRVVPARAVLIGKQNRFASRIGASV